MPSPTDPIRALRRQLLATALFATIAVLACAVWALSPAHVPSSETRAPIATSASASAPDADRPGPDPSAFQARLWNAPPAPAAAPKPAERRRETRLELQLISLIDDGDTLSAAIYDPARDRLTIVKAGDTIGAYTVQSVTAEAVEIAAGGRRQRLALREER